MAETDKVGVGHTPAKRKLIDDLQPVSPGESGQGLPYAPVDWPNPGDIWRWAATGKSIKHNGIYRNRVLFAPERLQSSPKRKLSFMSKKSVERYLRSEFPDVDVNVFFQSFAWDIPAKTDSKIKGKFVAWSQSVAHQNENRRLHRVSGIFKRLPQSSLRRKCQGPSGVTEIIDVTIDDRGISASDETAKYIEATAFQDGGEVSNSHATGSVGGNIFGSLLDPKVKTPNFTPEEFDNYLNSLDEIFAMTYPVKDMSPKNGHVEARRKLSSLLAMGFPSLISSNKLSEFLALASELQKDPNLSQKELSILKLIHEIPSVSQYYLEVKEASEQAEKFFQDLQSKIATVASLKNEYNTAKEEKEVFQAEEASTLLAILETKEEIDKLQARKMALAENIKKTNKRIVQCNTTQQKVIDCLPRIVHDVNVANSEKAEWELKKQKLAEQEAEILAKFAPLMGFSFYNPS